MIYHHNHHGKREEEEYKKKKKKTDKIPASLHSLTNIPLGRVV